MQRQKPLLIICRMAGLMIPNDLPDPGVPSTIVPRKGLIFIQPLLVFRLCRNKYGIFTEVGVSTSSWFWAKDSSSTFHRFQKLLSSYLRFFRFRFLSSSAGSRPFPELFIISNKNSFITLDNLSS